MSSAEYRQWVEYYNKEPFAVDRNELQLAQISDILAKTAGMESDAFDFMLSLSQEDKDKMKHKIKQKKVIEQLKNF